MLKQLSSSFSSDWYNKLIKSDAVSENGIAVYYTYPRKVTADRITFNSAISCCSQSWRRGLSVLPMMRAALVMPNEAWQRRMMTHARTLCGCDCDSFLLTRIPYNKTSKDSIRSTSLSMNVLAVSVCIQVIVWSCCIDFWYILVDKVLATWTVCLQICAGLGFGIILQYSSSCKL